MKRLAFYLSLLTVCTSLMSTTAQAGLYRWVDKQGEVHYADVVPAAVSTQGHTQLNKQGMTIATVAGAPSEAQLAAAKRQETLMKLRDALENQTQEQDDYLLANYADVSELEAVYNSKISLLDKNSQSLTERRVDLLSRMQSIQHEMPNADGTSQRKALEGYLNDAEKTLANYDYALQENATEKDLLRQSFEKDRERLAYLLSASPSSQHPDRSITPTTPHAVLARQ